MKPMHIMQKCVSVELWVMLKVAIVIVIINVAMKIIVHKIIIVSNTMENTNKQSIKFNNRAKLILRFSKSKI
jgi:hypothetical protein